MKLSNFAGLSLAILGLVALSGVQANAQILTGTFGFGPGGAALNPFASFDPTTGTGSVTGINETVNSAGGDFLSRPGAILSTTTVITVAPTTFSGSTGATTGFLTFASTSGETFSFNASSFAVASSSATSLHFEIIGTLVDTSASPLFMSSAADVSASFTSTGNNSNANVAFTFNTPPANTTPEPGAIAMLVGMGISGSAFAFRRRRNAK